MKQLTLFEVGDECQSAGQDIYGYPLARKSDPASSHQAAAEHRCSGRAVTHAEIVLRAVTESPGCTGHELAAATGLDQVEVIRRLGDLQRAGRVKKQPADRLCRVKPQSRQCVWFPIKEDRDASSESQGR